MTNENQQMKEVYIFVYVCEPKKFTARTSLVPVYAD